VAPPQTPLGQLTALPQTPWLYLRRLLLRGEREKRGGERLEGEGKEIGEGSEGKGEKERGHAPNILA